MSALKKNINLKNIAIGLIGLYFLYRIFKKDESGGTSDENVPVNYDRTTYSPYQYKVFADEIESAVWGTGPLAAWFEDDKEIGRILKEMQNIYDVYALIEAYGRRYVGVFLQEGGNLIQTIENYLDDDIKADVNNTYRSRGINFQF